MSCDMSEMRKMPRPRDESDGLQIQIVGSVRSAYCARVLSALRFTARAQCFTIYRACSVLQYFQARETHTRRGSPPSARPAPGPARRAERAMPGEGRTSRMNATYSLGSTKVWGTKSYTGPYDLQVVTRRVQLVPHDATKRRREFSSSWPRRRARSCRAAGRRARPRRRGAACPISTG
jgi:hypothetical protein